MLPHYIAATFRYLVRNKSFTAINLIGLATGITSCFFALLYVNFELNYDSRHEQADRIYRLITDVNTSSGVVFEGSSAPMAAAILETIPEVKDATRLMLDYMLIQRDDDLFDEETIAYADPNAFSIFTLPLIAGDVEQCLATPLSIVVSQSAARKYFGDDDPIGQTLILDRNQPATVTGIMKDMPYNSHLRTDFLLSMSTLLKVWNPSMDRNWKRFGCNTYLLLHEGTDISALSSKLSTLVNGRMAEEALNYNVTVEPLRNIYLYGKPRGHRTGSIETGTIINVIIFAAVSLIVLFIACFNFVNLTTAFSVQRAREMGIRKVMGAARRQLVIQLLADALLLSVLAYLLALSLCCLLLPSFNELAGKMISDGVFHDYRLAIWLFLIALATGVLSGIYPAFFISGLNPVSSLKGTSSPGKGKLLRQSLVVVQFAVTISLLVGTIVANRQLHFMQNQALGFDNTQKVVVDFYFSDKIPRVKTELARIAGVEGITISSCIPGRENRRMDTRIENADHAMQDLRVDAYFIDEQFLDEYQIDVVAGRGFSEHYSDSTEGMIVNEAMVKALGFHDPLEAIGKAFAQNDGKGVIIGVVKNFHAKSFHETILPLTFRRGGFYTFVTLTLSQHNIRETISRIKSRWAQLVPDMPFNYFFADDAYNAHYRKEERFEKVFVCFSAIAIILSCLGLIGLSTFSIARRTREIGIRKVLGSSSAGVVRLLLTEFIILMVIAFTIAVPFAWLAAREWLSSFAYRIDVSGWMFLASGATVTAIAVTSIIIQTLRAAMTNPTVTLRRE